LILKTAVGVVRRERLRPDSLLLLAKWSVNSRWCPNPQGEFIGCSEMSLEQQKKDIRSERRMTPTAEYRLIVDEVIYGTTASLSTNGREAGNYTRRYSEC
jgi:hypothetical protein